MRERRRVISEAERHIVQLQLNWMAAAGPPVKGRKGKPRGCSHGGMLSACSNALRWRWQRSGLLLGGDDGGAAGLLGARLDRLQAGRGRGRRQAWSTRAHACAPARRPRLPGWQWQRLAISMSRLAALTGEPMFFDLVSSESGTGTLANLSCTGQRGAALECGAHEPPPALQPASLQANLPSSGGGRGLSPSCRRSCRPAW